MPPGSFDKGARIKRWERRLESPQQALKQIGALMKAESQKSFKEQAFGDKKWDERAVPNVYGIIQDFSLAKKEPPGRRFESRPALRDTGRLLGSISFALKGSDAVQVGSNLEYAGRLHHGGPIRSEVITKEVQKRLWKWLRGKGSKWKAELGWLLNKKFTGKRLEGRVDARPFVGVTKQTVKDVARVVGVTIFEAQ